MGNDSKIKKMCDIGRDGNKISQLNKICWDNGNKVKRIIRSENVVRATFPYRTKRVKRRNLASSKVPRSFTDTGGSGGWSTKVLSRRLLLLLANGTPFTYPGYNFAPLLTSVNELHITGKFYWLFHSHKMHPSAFDADSLKWQIFIPFNIIQQHYCNPYPFILSPGPYLRILDVRKM